MRRWHTPLDPDCPALAEYLSGLFEDPMTEAMGAPVHEFIEAFARRHRVTCERCWEYSAPNIEVLH